jgi:SAM-dependent methyltransferase
MSAGTRETALSRQYVKLCDIRDFDDPELRASTTSVPASSCRYTCTASTGSSRCYLFLEDSGLLREDARVLSVGAGHETVLFWLANRVAKVVATDIYGEGSFSEQAADRTMLTEPASFSPYPYRESHLEVRHMDARKLEFPDNSFDAVFSLSSIEHFGSWADIRRSASEIGRVLRHGGSAYIATECFLGRSAFGPRAVQGARSRLGGTIRIFTPRTLMSVIVGPSGLELVQPLDTTAPETSANVIELDRDGGITSTTGADYPHIALRVKRLGIHTQSWTSVGLAMSKPFGGRFTVTAQ